MHVVWHVHCNPGMEPHSPSLVIDCTGTNFPISYSEKANSINGKKCLGQIKKTNINAAEYQVQIVTGVLPLCDFLVSCGDIQILNPARILLTKS